MALITVGDLKDEGRFTADEFGWDDPDDSALLYWLADVVLVASSQTKHAVGAANYASVDADVKAVITRAEMYKALAQALQRRLVFLSSRPEEGPPPEYIDLGALERQISRYEEMWEELVGLYRTDSDDQPGVAFSFGIMGVDESSVKGYYKSTGAGLAVEQFDPTNQPLAETDVVGGG